MKVFRVVKDKNYTTINNTIIRDKRISTKTKGFFITIMSLPDDWDFSVSGMNSIMQEGKTFIYSCIEELESFGYLDKKRKRNQQGKIIGVEYYFYETPINKGLNPQSGFPYVDKPNVDNQPQLSTKLNKDLSKEKDISGFQENTPLDSSKDLSKDQTIDFDLLLKFFNQVTGKKIRKVIPKAKKGFISIIKSGYSKADIKNAIINCYKDEYHINTNHKYLTLEFISRMDKFEKYFDVKHKVEVLPSDWFHRELTDNQKKMLKPSSLENWERNKSARQLEGGKLLPIKIEYEQ
jgi:hypothetical protein